jgi:hypothetical protein
MDEDNERLIRRCASRIGDLLNSGAPKAVVEAAVQEFLNLWTSIAKDIRHNK